MVESLQLMVQRTELSFRGCKREYAGERGCLVPAFKHDRSRKLRDLWSVSINHVQNLSTMKVVIGK